MILADTGFWVALVSRRDRNHAAAVAALAEHGGETLIVTWPVLVETVHLLQRRVSVAAALHFLTTVRDGICTVVDAPDDAVARMLTLMHKYADLPMDLADASLVLAAETLGDGRILSTDTRDFRTYRFKNRKPFKNLLALG